MQLEQLSISDAATKSLAEWQQMLVVHFTVLSKNRKEKSISVFALEHGLKPAQIKIISSRLADDHRLNGINKSYWLLWVIYSTELGYEYIGDQYWISFEDKLRYWEQSHREIIRWAFKEFQRRFNGVLPTGTWAKNFPIIAWPITHAILPQDLQYHFAKLLFLSRYTLNTSQHKNAADVGKLLARFAYSFSSSRFLNFLQHEELVGRIALALLAEKGEGSLDDNIYSTTLKRITEDIEQKQNAKELMQGFRREIKPRIYGANSNSKIKNNNESSYRPVESSKKSVKPKIRLHNNGNNWVATIEIPRLADIIDDASVTEQLKKSRVKINGVNSTWLPAEVLLGASFIRKLSEWPSGDTLLNFESKIASLSELTQSINISKGPWLFHLNVDGQAIEVQNKNVWACEEYLIVSENNGWPESELLSDCDIECKGIHAKKLTIPDNLSEVDEKILLNLGVYIQKSIRVWPAGLPAQSWDGSGSGEWLTTESICLGILGDYPIDEFHISLGSYQLTIKGKVSGSPTFIRLDPLPCGSHMLKIEAISQSSVTKNTECYVHLEIREPEGWIQGATLHNGLTFQLDPYTDDLDALLTGKIQVKVFGPKNRSIIFQLDFFVGKEIVRTISSKSIQFPFHDGELKKACEQANKDDNLIYSHKLRLRILCEDLGYKDIIFLRKAAPIGWLFKSVDRVPNLKLIDETDCDEPLKILYCDLNEPEVKRDISTENFSQLKSTQLRNGLFFARRGEHNCSIVISHSDRLQGFEALSISPKLISNEALNIPGYLSFINTWFTARSSGFLAQHHQQKVIEAATIKLFSHLCGTNWARAEKEFINDNDIAGSIEKLSHFLGNTSVQNILRYKLLGNDSKEINLSEMADWLNGVLKRCNVCHSDSLVSFALELASRPLSYAGTKEEQFSEMLNVLLSNKTILRSCRFVVLATAKYIDPNRNYPLLLPTGWQ